MAKFWHKNIAKKLANFFVNRYFCNISQIQHHLATLCRGRWRNVRADCCTVGLCCVTTVWSQISKGSFQVTVSFASLFFLGQICNFWPFLTPLAFFIFEKTPNEIWIFWPFWTN